MKNKCRHAFGTEIDLVINGTLHTYSTKSFHQTSYTAFHLSLTTREDIALKNVTDLSPHCSKSHEWLLGSNKNAGQEPRSHLSVALRCSAAQWLLSWPLLPTPVSVLCEAI